LTLFAVIFTRVAKLVAYPIKCHILHRQSKYDIINGFDRLMRIAFSAGKKSLMN
jgi:hypothetical protein